MTFDAPQILFLLSLFCTIFDLQVILTMSINKLTYDGKFYRWNGSLDELKSFVEQQLKLHGSWTSPGGETKVFRLEQSDFIIKRYGASSKKIIIQVDK